MSEVKSYQFQNLKTEDNSKTKTYDFPALNLVNTTVKDNVLSSKIIRMEREVQDRNSGFKVDERVREGRGHLQQEREDIDKKISQEIQQRSKLTLESAFKEGRDQGEKQGKDQAFQEIKKQLSPYVVEMEALIEKIREQQEFIIKSQLSNMHLTLKRLLKWLVLKETATQDYLPLLLEKLLNEIQGHDHLIIRVGEEWSQKIPSLLSTMESRFGKIKNLRIEIDPHLKHGLLLENENGLIDGTEDALLKTIDKLFHEALNDERK